MEIQQLQENLSEHFTDKIISCIIDKDHVVLTANVDNLYAIFLELKSELKYNFQMFMDLTAVDWLDRQPRFDLVYHLYSVELNHRLRIKIPLIEGQAVSSVSGLWSIADWMEREIWDLYGIKFSGHPNLKRILMYDEFKGHPLRKDFAYDQRQPLIQDAWPSRPFQVNVKGLKIHRPGNDV